MPSRSISMFVRELVVWIALLMTGPNFIGITIHLATHVKSTNKVLLDYLSTHSESSALRIGWTGISSVLMVIISRVACS